LRGSNRKSRHGYNSTSYREKTAFERLIEAFALLAARVRRKIDDEFPEVVESLLNLLYPITCADAPMRWRSFV